MSRRFSAGGPIPAGRGCRRPGTAHPRTRRSATRSPRTGRQYTRPPRPVPWSPRPGLPSRRRPARGPHRVAGRPKLRSSRPPSATCGRPTPTVLIRPTQRSEHDPSPIVAEAGQGCERETGHDVASCRITSRGHGVGFPELPELPDSRRRGWAKSSYARVKKRHRATRGLEEKTTESVLTRTATRDILPPHTAHGRQGSLLPQLDGGHRAAGPACPAEGPPRHPDRRIDSWHTEVQLPMPNLDSDQRKRVLIVDQSADSRQRLPHGPGAPWRADSRSAGRTPGSGDRPPTATGGRRAWIWRRKRRTTRRSARPTRRELAEQRAELVILGNLRRSRYDGRPARGAQTLSLRSADS